jgi:hypothetical protein
MQDDSGASEDEPGDGAPARRHQLKFNSRLLADRERLRNRPRPIRDEIGLIEYQGEQVYRTPTQNVTSHP